VGNWYDKSRTIDRRWHHFQKKIDKTILPLFLTTYFPPKFSKLSPTKLRTKNRSYLANDLYVIEISAATTVPDMTFLYVYFGMKHPVGNRFVGDFSIIKKTQTKEKQQKITHDTMRSADLVSFA